MHTYKIVYTIANEDGRKVTFIEDACADFARMKVYDQNGGEFKCTIWSVEEVKFN